MASFCASCGVAKGDPNDRFCRSCGQPYDVAPAAAAPPPPPPPTAPIGQPTPAPPMPVAPPVPAAPPSPPAKSGGPQRRTLLAVVGSVIAIVAAGAIAWQFFIPRGGAGSPEDVARSLIEAGTEQDPLALVDMMSPAEVEGLDSIVEEVRKRAEDEDLLGKDRLVDAVDMKLSDLEFDVTELGDDLARVEVTGGTYEVSWDPAKLPDRLAFLRDQSEAESDRGDLKDLLDGDPLFIVTAKVGGRWYLSGIGTAMEYLYRGEVDEDADVDEPDYEAASEEPEPITGKDAEDVVDNVVRAINDGDVGDLLANLPADLVAPLRPYVPIVEDILSGRYNDGQAIRFDVSADDLKLDTEDIGDGRVKVTVDRAALAGSVTDGEDGASGSLTVDGPCATVSDDGYENEAFCFGDDSAAGDVFRRLGIKDYFLVLREEGDGYQLDPIATVAEYGALAVRSLDKSLVKDLLERWQDEVS